MAEEPQQLARPRSTGRSFIMAVLVLALLAAVLWLAAERNARQWFLVPEDGQLVVKKGVLFLTGRSNFKTDDAVLAQTYTPLRPPPGVAPPAEQQFDDRAGLDQGLYDLLSRWARNEIASEDPQRLERGLGYLTRAERLAGVSATQREDLRKLRGESGFFEAKSLIERAAEELRLAREKLQLAAEAPTRHAADATALLRQVDSLATETLRASRAAASAAAPKETSPSGTAPNGSR